MYGPEEVWLCSETAPQTYSSPWLRRVRLSTYVIMQLLTNNNKYGIYIIHVHYYYYNHENDLYCLELELVLVVK